MWVRDDDHETSEYPESELGYQLLGTDIWDWDIYISPIKQIWRCLDFGRSSLDLPPTQIWEKWKHERQK